MLETDFKRQMVARIEDVVPKTYDGRWLDDALCDLLEDPSDLARQRLMHNVDTLFNTLEEDWKLSHVCTLTDPAATEVIEFTRRTYPFPMLELTSVAICKDATVPAKIILGQDEIKVTRAQIFEDIAEFCEEHKRTVSSSFVEVCRFLTERMIGACGPDYQISRGPQNSSVVYPHIRFKIERTKQKFDFGCALLITAPQCSRSARFTPGQRR